MVCVCVHTGVESLTSRGVSTGVVSITPVIAQELLDSVPTPSSSKGACLLRNTAVDSGCFRGNGGGWCEASLPLTTVCKHKYIHVYLLVHVYMYISTSIHVY